MHTSIKRRIGRHFLNTLRARLQLHFDNTSGLSVPDEKQFRVWIWQAVKNHFSHAQISLILLNEDEARGYNRDYRGKDYATNVLSFALDEGESALCDPSTLHGDLLICPQVVLREAQEQGKTPEAHFAHLTIHGTLHLMGYDHMNDEEAEEMEQLETQLMAQLGYSDPYAQDEI